MCQIHSLPPASLYLPPHFPLSPMSVLLPFAINLISYFPQSSIPFFHSSFLSSYLSPSFFHPSSDPFSLTPSHSPSPHPLFTLLVSSLNLSFLLLSPLFLRLSFLSYLFNSLSPKSPHYSFHPSHYFLSSSCVFHPPYHCRPLSIIYPAHHYSHLSFNSPLYC